MSQNILASNAYPGVPVDPFIAIVHAQILSCSSFKCELLLRTLAHWWDYLFLLRCPLRGIFWSVFLEGTNPMSNQE